MALGHFLEKGTFTLPRAEEVLQDMMVIDLHSMRQLDRNVSDSIGIAAAHEVKNFLIQKPVVSSRRTLIIDDAELMTTEAQNALLKVIEEPPASSLIILVVSDTDAIVPTVLSRVRRMYLGLVMKADIVSWLKDIHAVPNAKAIDLASRSFGRPGLAWRLAFDTSFAEELGTAERFLRLPAAARRDFIKDLIAPDGFNLRVFLDRVALVLSWDPSLRNKADLWHRTLSLCDTAANFGVNPRLQLENLLG